MDVDVFFHIQKQVAMAGLAKNLAAKKNPFDHTHDWFVLRCLNGKEPALGCTYENQRIVLSYIAVCDSFYQNADNAGAKKIGGHVGKAYK
jgi:hypothetical protein